MNQCYVVDPDKPVMDLVVAASEHEAAKYGADPRRVPARLVKHLRIDLSKPGARWSFTAKISQTPESN